MFSGVRERVRWDKWVNVERKFYFAYFQGDQMLGFVVVGKDHFPFLYLKLWFACDAKETLIQFDLWLLWL